VLFHFTLSRRRRRRRKRKRTKTLFGLMTIGDDMDVSDTREKSYT